MRDNSQYFQKVLKIRIIESVTSFLLPCQIVWSLGTFLSFHALIVSQPSASIYFGFDSKYINGAASLYRDVLTGALRTVSLSDPRV